MESEKLTKSMIADARLYRMVLRVEADALKVVIYSTVEDNSLIYRSLPLDSQAQSPLRALEDVVYDNALLLSDFDRVSVIVDTKRFMAAPADMAADADDCELMMTRALALADDEAQILASPTGEPNAVLLMALDNDLDAFLRRTFIAPRIYHHLSPLCRYFAAMTAKVNVVRTYINVRPSALDIIVMEKGRLLLANTFSYRENSDAVYYVMACRNTLGLGRGDGEVMICGDKKGREALTAALREHVDSVLPVIFPSQMLKLGAEAIDVPFDLIVLPLCE